jgi:hypothetical protein
MSTYKDTLGSILKKSFEPFRSTPLNESIYINTEDFIDFDMMEYKVLTEKSLDSPHSKYTIISKHNDAQDEKTPDEKQAESFSETPTNAPLNRAASVHNIPVMDIHMAKQFDDTHHMSVMNTVYIGSLTVVGLYVLFRYMKY